MKKVTTILLVLAMIASIVLFGISCKQEETATAEDSGATEAEETESITEETESTETTEEEQKYLILVNNSMTDDFTIFLDAGMKEACAENGWKYELMDANGDVEAYTRLIENAISKSPDVIAVNVLDGDMNADACQKAMDAGIIVVAVGNLPNIPVDISVTFNPYEAGVQCGEYLAENLDGKGPIVVVLYEIMNNVHIQRYKGLTDVLVNYPEIEIVEEQHVAFNLNSGVQAAENLLTGHPEAVGACCSFGLPAIAFGDALAKIDKADDFCLVGMDGDKELLAGIKEGNVDMTSAMQSTRYMAKVAFGELVNFLNGDEYTAAQMTHQIIITADNVDEQFEYLYGSTLEDYMSTN